MGATSVTGVSGAGSVQDGSKAKGSEHMSLGVSKLVGPRVYLAGQVTLASGGATVYYPTINDNIANYVGFSTDTTAVNAVAVTSLTTTSITLSGTGSHVVNWLIVKCH